MLQGAETKYGIILKTFYSLISPILKKRDKSKFLGLTLLFKHFLKIKIQTNMNKPEKKRQRIYDLLNAETKPKFPCLTNTRQIILFFFFFLLQIRGFYGKAGVEY